MHENYREDGLGDIRGFPTAESRASAERLRAWCAEDIGVHAAEIAGEVRDLTRRVMEEARDITNYPNPIAAAYAYFTRLLDGYKGLLTDAPGAHDAIWIGLAELGEELPPAERASLDDMLDEGDEEDDVEDMTPEDLLLMAKLRSLSPEEARRIRDARRMSEDSNAHAEESVRRKRGDER